MALTQLYNLVRVSTATTGTGTVTLGGAVANYLTFAQGGVATGATVRYGILDANGAKEVGHGVYTLSGLTLTRVLENSSTGSLINLSGSAQVFITPSALDFARTGSFTLTASVTSTVVTDSTCASTSVVVPVATTAHAALAIPSMWIVSGAGSFTVYHANNSYTDRTFNYVIH
jgi:hypothetical protein